MAKKKVSASKTESKTPLVDRLVNKAAEGIVKENWPGLLENQVSEKNIRRARRALRK